MWAISYWIFPIISGFCWLRLLMGLLIHWCAIGKPHFPSMSSTQKIAYVSDVRAEKIKPLFIAGACVTTIFLDLAVVSERWLRHRGRLVRNMSGLEKVLSILSIVFAFIGTAGLILLSIFDTLRHPTLHGKFLILFIGCYIVSAVFACWEYQRLGIKFCQHCILRYSFWVKLAFIGTEGGLAIVFAIEKGRERVDDAAVLEWAISFVFTFYILSFFLDLVPAVETKHTGEKFGLEANETAMQQEQNDNYSCLNLTGHGVESSND